MTESPAWLDAPGVPEITKERYAQAIEAIDRANEILARDKGNYDAWADLGWALFITGDVNEGKKCLEYAMELDPSKARAPQLLGIVSHDTAHPEEARRWLKRALAINPNDARSIYYLGLIARDEQAHAEARQLFEKALSLMPQDHHVLFELARLDLREGRAETAISRLEQVVRLRPYHLGAHFNLARAYQAVGRAEDAARHRDRHAELSIMDDQGVRDRPTSVTRYLAMASWYLDRGLFDKALEETRTGTALYPREARLWGMHGKSLERLGRLEDAARAFERAAEEGAEDVALLREAAAFFFGALDDPARALRHAEQASEAAGGTDAPSWYLIAQARWRLDRRVEGIEALERAVELEPGRAEWKDTLDRWRESLEGDPSGDEGR